MAWENFPYSYTSPHIHSWIFEALQVIIFWVRVTHKMLNVNWEKIHSIILSVTCHGLRNFAPAHTHPLKTIHEFLRPYELLFSELVTCKMLNVNWEKIHSIILSVTCHGLRNFPLLIHIPLKPICEFLKPYKSDYVLTVAPRPLKIAMGYLIFQLIAWLGYWKCLVKYV